MSRQEPADRDKTGAAVEWLRDYLAQGEKRSRDVLAAADKAGHSQATIYRARKNVVRAEQRGYPGRAFWFLKESSIIAGSQVENGEKPGSHGKPMPLAAPAADEVEL